MCITIPRLSIHPRPRAWRTFVPWRVLSLLLRIFGCPDKPVAPTLRRTANCLSSQRLVRPEDVEHIRNASACRRPADGDRPRSSWRTANRPGSQRFGRPQNDRRIQNPSACSRAADGDRPRSGRRTANRPSSQRLVSPQNARRIQNSSACSRAADGDRRRFRWQRRAARSA